MNVGRGRAIFFGGNDTFNNVVLEKQGHQNRDLLKNMVKWLGESGGPYKQYKVVNEQAQNALSNAESLYEDNEFSEAKKEFDSALELFLESKEMYPNADAESGIAEVERFVPTCEIGAEADTIFEKAEELFGKREYENAITEYGKAQALYDQIECEEKVEVCSKGIEESTAKISLREEATALYSKGKDTLAQAPSFLSTGGYEESKSLFEQARSIWEEYGDADRVAECQEKIDLCDEKISGIKKNQYMIIGAVAAAACVVVLFMWWRKPKPKAAEAPPEPEEVPEASPMT